LPELRRDFDQRRTILRSLRDADEYSTVERLHRERGGGAMPSQGIHIDDDARGQGRGYSFEILHQPSFALAVVKLQAEQSILAEAGAMVSMSANVELQSQMKGGLMGALKRAVGGESAFISTFTARGGPGEVSFAPGGPGDIAAIEMSSQMFMVQSSSYLAGDANLTIDTKWGGAKTFFGGEGLFVLQVSGSGLLLLSSFGAIHRKRLRRANATWWTRVISSPGKRRWRTRCAKPRRVSSARW
jgi:uncharacterized protein (TIGR00266 family)